MFDDLEKQQNQQNQQDKDKLSGDVPKQDDAKKLERQQTESTPLAQAAAPQPPPSQPPPSQPPSPIIPKDDFNQRVEKLREAGKKGKNKKALYAIVGAIVLLLTGGGVVAGYKYWPQISKIIGIGPEDEAVCTLDAKECRDGSYVARIPPDCEFAQCPEVTCIKEGETFSVDEHPDFIPECCNNLESAQEYEIIDNQCELVYDFAVCINCGNQECGPGEDECNCPEDCGEFEEETKEIEEIDISDWQTYQNKALGYKFQYPNDWTVLGEDNYLELANSVVTLEEIEISKSEEAFAQIPDTEMVREGSVYLDNYEVQYELYEESIEDEDAQHYLNIFVLEEDIYYQLDLNQNNLDTVYYSFYNVISSTIEFIDEVEAVDEEQIEIDSDEDGLTDEEEDEYGTDPDNPDSDGDGYLDGDEVENGYNPMGEGKL